MKIRKTLKRSGKYSYITAGISVNNNQPVFNWQEDCKDDVLHLVQDTSGDYTEDGVNYFYGYTFNPNSSFRDRKTVRDYMKGIAGTSELFAESTDELVERAVLNLDAAFNLKLFSAIVWVEPNNHPSLVDVMREWLMEYGSGRFASFELIKKSYDNVKFNRSKAKQLLRESDPDFNRYETDEDLEGELDFIENKFETLKSSGKLFQMKRITPTAIRSSYYDFLEFRNEQEKRIYMDLQGVNVLVYDDFLTTGTTVKEILRYLNSINPNNTLTVFVLVKQH